MKLQEIQNTDRQDLDSVLPLVFFNNSAKGENVRVLTNDDMSAVLRFLKKRPSQTVVLTSFIKDKGFDHIDHRGTFYGFENSAGELEGIALIGHTTLIEAHTHDAVAAFAAIARRSEMPIHLIMSDNGSVEIFWKHYNETFQTPRLVCTELLFEIGFPFAVQNCEWDVRLANTGELDQIAEAHAEIAFIESGVDPLEKDPDGFLRRCIKRIEEERTFVVFDKEKLVFKADIVAETDDVIYLEGVFVAPEYRGRGIGSACLATLSVALLDRVQTICLLSNKDFTNAHKMAVKAGYQNTGSCQTIFV